MAYVWFRKGRLLKHWFVMNLCDSHGSYFLTGNASKPLTPRKHRRKSYPGYIISHDDPDGFPKWILYAGPKDSIFINGDRLSLGMKVLMDKDEIFVAPSGRMFFSAETQAHIEPFPGPERAKCARCYDWILAHTPAVKCPNCGTWHHQDEDHDLPCWTYSETCGSPACSQPTSLDADFQWTPEDL